LLVKIHGKPIRALLDTGSGCTLIKSSLAQTLNLPVRDIAAGELTQMFAAEGSRLHVKGVSDVTFNISGLFILHSVYIVDNISQSLIFGSDFMLANNVVIDYSNKIVSLCSDLIRAQLINVNDRQQIARLSKTVCIPAGTEQIVHIKCSSHLSNQDVLVEPVPYSQFNKYAIARTLCRTDKDCNTVARVLNCE
jgi:hypothetical protein